MSNLRRIALFAAVLGLVLTGPPVAAQEPAQNETAYVQMISGRCTSIRVILRRVHTNDALTRVNAGQAYHNIAVQLMARFNSRLALNRLDSARFIDITKQYEAALKQFGAGYSDYEKEMSQLIRTDCRQRPEAFYASLQKTRQARQALTGTVEELHRLIAAYQAEVTALRTMQKESHDT